LINALGKLSGSTTIDSITGTTAAAPTHAREHARTGLVRGMPEPRPSASSCPPSR
jgi:hypothetical protein